MNVFVGLFSGIRRSQIFIWPLRLLVRTSLCFINDTQCSEQLSAFSILRTTFWDNAFSRFILPSSPIVTTSLSFMAKLVQGLFSPFSNLCKLFHVILVSIFICSEILLTICNKRTFPLVEDAIK